MSGYIANPRSVRQLDLEISGINGPLPAPLRAGGDPADSAAVRLRLTSGPQTIPDDDVASHLRSSAIVQSNHPAIADRAGS